MWGRSKEQEIFIRIYFICFSLADFLKCFEMLTKIFITKHIIGPGPVFQFRRFYGAKIKGTKN